MGNDSSTLDHLRGILCFHVETRTPLAQRDDRISTSPSAEVIKGVHEEGYQFNFHAFRCSGSDGRSVIKGRSPPCQTRRALFNIAGTKKEGQFLKI